MTTKIVNPFNSNDMPAHHLFLVLSADDIPAHYLIIKEPGKAHHFDFFSGKLFVGWKGSV